MKKFMPLMLTVGLLTAVLAPVAAAETTTTTTSTTTASSTSPSTQSTMPASGTSRGGTVSLMSDGVGPCSGC
ncbi:hypothetical protein [Deinococcus xianganensis]|uniref:Uncharacterized protein n=1 Tax=Deinococcus xianganensis TaxID=1507289 RepID=A0A6I4YUJ5_9DEIO|nr:hypothetical protein [Deinococcus xianganensis]MXV20783.1 hypothetical protein [Deinococcus xianganensis]